MRGAEGRLWLPNVTYEHRGRYTCVASNIINGEERSDRSDPVHLKVVGKCPVDWGEGLANGRTMVTD